MASGGPSAPDQPLRTDGERDAVDLAIALDTSGSMEGLIDAARLKLWEIVNALALAEPTPRLRVALLTFGNSSHNRERGWVNVETGLTEDLDLVSQRLFELETRGGTEYVGRLLQVALQDLTWTDSDGALKLLFVAGNEPADQDPEVDYRMMNEEAHHRGMTINTIFCGSPRNDDAEAWREIARLTDGQFAAIDHRTGTVVVATPFDEELADLGRSLNETYVPLGEAGREGQDNQSLQDRNARELDAATAAARAVTKSSPLYSCSWDLVSALDGGRLTLDDLEDGDLPETMRAMSTSEREDYIDTQRRRRAEIRSRVADLDAKRRAYIAEKTKSSDLDDSRAFDAAVRRALRRQIEARGLELSLP